MSLRSRPSNYKNFDVSFPHERVVQVTINRPDKLNCIDKATSRAIAEIWELFDKDETLWVAIITGNGRAFCTGADLGGGFAFFLLLSLQLTKLTQYEQNGTQ
jgi:enoyl-CoA hydratase/carnithine racemase